MAFYTTKDQKVKMLSAKAFVGLDLDGTATWTLAKSSDILSYNKTPGDSAPAFEIPLTDYFSQDELVGTTIDKVVIHYNVTVADITTATAEFHTVAYNATTNVPAATTVAATGTLTKTAAATYAIELTPASTIKVDQDTLVSLEVVFTGAATTAIKLYGLDIYYTPAGE